MSDPVDVPRPDAYGDRSIGDRWRVLRSDPRVGVAVLGCVAVAAGVAWFRSGIAPAAPARVAPVSTATPTAHAGTTRAATTPTSGSIVVDVVGAVHAPGVVSLPATARVLDAIRAAGGATPGADLERLNLAAKVIDGARVAVPAVGRPPPPIDPSAVSGSADPPGGASGAALDGPAAPIDVNSATVAQLETLPGIGPSLAAAIVQERERNGPFRSIDDLTRVPGIGSGRLAQLRDFVAV